MARKVVGRISREMNTQGGDESINYRGPKDNGAKVRRNRRIEAPPTKGIGPYYRDV